MKPLDEAAVRALFMLAGIPVLRMWTLIDGYGYRSTDPRFYETPPRQVWWLVKTPYGLIEIGARKKVIEIEWSDTNITADVTTDDVTKHLSMVHAWSIEKALGYLITWRRVAESFGSDKPNKIAEA